MSASRAVALVAVTALMASGCSVVFGERATRPARGLELMPRCSTSRGPIYADLTVAALSAATAVAAVVVSFVKDDGTPGASSDDLRAMAVGYVGYAALSVYASRLGQRSVAECQQAREQHERWIRDHAGEVKRP